MALPDDPKTTTDTTAPPPKEPPVVDADILTPKSPSNLPPNVRISSPAQAIANLRILDVSDEALIAAFKDKPLYVLDRVNWSRLNSPYRKRLENLINKDPGLKKILDYVLPVYPAAAPQPQPQPTTAAQEIPEYKIPLEEKPAPKTPLGPDNAKFIENWLNGIKPGFYEYLAAKARADPGKFSAATDRRAFTDNFFTYFAMYRSQLPEILWEESVQSLLRGALGSVGDAWEKYYYWNMQRKVKWMKNPLNPNALYYWLNSLPTQKAFQVAFIPFKAAWGIFARGNAPLFTKAVYQYVERNPYSLDYGKSKLKESYFFSPLLKFSQGTSKLADNLDKTINEIDPEIVNKHFNRVLNDLKQTKKQFLSSRIVGDELTRENAATALSKARRNLKNQLNRRDGKFLQSWFKPLKKNLSRRLRHVSRDPINGLLALLAGSIMDMVIGIGVNFVRTAVSKVINHIPGLNTLRAQINEFFTSSRWFRIANTARIGGATIGNFGKALVNPTSFSSGYLGAGAGGWIANALGLPILPGQVIGGGIGYGLGTFYKTSLNSANMGLYNRYGQLNPVGWTKEYEIYKSANTWRLDEGGATWSEQMIKDHYLKGFKPGPFSNFARWLYNHPYARLPINGFVIADLGVKLLGWNPWIVYPSFITGDWLWQTRGAWSQALARWFPTTPLGRWIGNQVLSAQTWFTEKIFMRPIAWETSSLLGKMPVKWGLRPFWQFMQNTWSTIQPYASNFFNPGFFLGAQFLGPVFMGMGIPFYFAYPLGALAGTGIWWGIHGIYSAIAGKGAMSLAKWSAAGWVGYFGGLITQGLLSLLGVHGAWMQFLPMAGSLIATVGVALIPGLGGFLGSFFAGLSTYNIAWALGVSSTAYAAGMAIAATVASIALVAGLTIFSGFVIYSAFWVPLQEMMRAGPESSCFSSQTSANISASGSAEICSRFTVKNPGLLTEYGYLEEFTGVYYLEVNGLAPQDNITKATRQSPPGSLRDLSFDRGYHTNPGLINNTFTNLKYAVKLPDLTSNQPFSTGLNKLNEITTFLSTYTSYETGKKTVFELQGEYGKDFPGLLQISSGYIDLLQQIKKDLADNNKNTQTKLEANIDVLEEIKGKFNNVVADLNSAKVDDAYAIADSASDANNNPYKAKVDAVCPPQDNLCPELKGIYQFYTSFFAGQKSILGLLKSQVENSTTDSETVKAYVKNAYQQAEFTLQGLTQQIAGLKDTKKSVEDLYDNSGFWNDWATLLENITGPSDQINPMLQIAFPEFFGNDKKFFFVPGGTTYELCVQGKYTGPTDKPIVFSSGINMVQTGLMFNPTTILQFTQPACSAISSVTVNP